MAKSRARKFLRHKLVVGLSQPKSQGLLDHRGIDLLAPNPCSRGPLPAGLEQPVVEHTGCQVAPDKPKHPPVRDARCHPCHEFVVINSVKKFRQIYIDDEPIAFGDVGLRLRHRLLGRASRPKAVAVLAERRVPQRLQPLQHRLLDHAVDHGWNAEVACPAGRFRDLHPTHRLRLVRPWSS